MRETALEASKELSVNVPEIIPIPLQPEVQKNLTPAAVKRSEPPIFDPEREDGSEEEREKRRKSGRRAQRHPQNPDDPPQSNEPGRGTRINIRA